MQAQRCICDILSNAVGVNIELALEPYPSRCLHVWTVLLVLGRVAGAFFV
jgi:hypothetical protein